MGIFNEILFLLTLILKNTKTKLEKYFFKLFNYSSLRQLREYINVFKTFCNRSAIWLIANLFTPKIA